jgi:hypothetical protein
LNDIEIEERIVELNEDALFMDGFDEALIGYIESCASSVVAVYDYDKVIGILQKDHEMDREEAVDWYEFNMVGAYMGENTPVFFHGFE